MERHEAELLRYALSLVRDLPSAEDLVQDAFFKLCKQEPESLRGRLVPWLFTVVRNQAMDRHRRESRWPRAAEAEAAEDVHDPIEEEDDLDLGENCIIVPQAIPGAEEPAADTPASKAKRGKRSRIATVEGDEEEPAAPPKATKGRRQAAKGR